MQSGQQRAATSFDAAASVPGELTSRVSAGVRSTLAELAAGLLQVWGPPPLSAYRIAEACALHCESIGDPIHRAVVWFTLRSAAAGRRQRVDRDPFLPVYLSALRHLDSRISTKTREAWADNSGLLCEMAVLHGVLTGKDSELAQFSLLELAAAVADRGPSVVDHETRQTLCGSFKDRARRFGIELPDDRAGSGPVESLHETVDQKEIELQEFEAVFAKALRNPLTASEQKTIIGGVGMNPLLAFCLSPSQHLAQLVSTNVAVAVELMKVILTINEGDAESVRAIVNLYPSLPAMELVLNLASGRKLLPEHLHSYLANCTSTCERTTDRFAQQRLVVLVCMFIQSLLRDHLVDLGEIIIQVQAFCIQFSRIRQAAALFRQISQQSPPG